MGYTTANFSDAKVPTAGGIVVDVNVYEMPDVAAAQRVVELAQADRDGWAVDGERPREQLEGGHYVPRTVVSGASTALVDTQGWSGVLQARDAAEFQDDGSAASGPHSEAVAWLSRDTLVVILQVVGDDPGAAGGTATDVIERFAGSVG